MFSGAQVRTVLETELGGAATTIREEPASYVVEVKVQVKLPQPHKDLAALSKLNDQLPVLLPGLPALLESAKVSPLFEELYRLKVAQLQQSLNRFDTLLSRHNLFDCETLLELQNPATKRRALLIQADMDTDSDGSDSDRVPEIDGSSATFQPMTSYRWAKKTDKPNSFLVPREAKLKQYETELATSGVSASRSKELKAGIARVKAEIGDLKQFSFLVAATDPYVVMPLSMFGKKTPFRREHRRLLRGHPRRRALPRRRRRCWPSLQNRRRLAAPLPADQCPRQRRESASQRPEGHLPAFPRHRRPTL